MGSQWQCVGLSFDKAIQCYITIYGLKKGPIISGENLKIPVIVTFDPEKNF